MKTIYKCLTMVLVIGVFSACEADPDEGLPSFDNSLPLYVQIGPVSNSNADGDIITSPEEGDDFNITVELPEVIYGDVNVTWEIAGSLVSSGSATISEGDLNSMVVIPIPDDGVAGGGSASFTLTAVDNGLTLGRQNATSSIISTDLTWEDNQ